MGMQHFPDCCESGGSGGLWDGGSAGALFCRLYKCYFLLTAEGSPDRSPRSAPEDQAGIAQPDQSNQIGFAGGGLRSTTAAGGHGTECFPLQIMPLVGSAVAQLLSQSTQTSPVKGGGVGGLGGQGRGDDAAPECQSPPSLVL